MRTWAETFKSHDALINRFKMIKRAHKRWKKDEVISLFDPVIGEWFSKFEKLTEPQEYAIPLIHRGKNVLVSSPTGSGKTLTAFMSIINELFLLAKKGKLEDKIYCVYISPLKALANDIHRNLEVPLEEIEKLALKKGIKIPKIRIAVRSGDTSTSERQKMLRKPPHIFITTPESLALALTAPKFREKFKEVKYVIVDEIHELANNKRGVMLSLNLERLAYYAGEFQRIGLSATQAPLEDIARFLGGYNGDQEREVWIVDAKIRKDMDLRVITPVEDLTLTPYEVASERMYDILVDMIRKHRTTLIFTNTRSGTEHVAYKLKERGVEKLEAHHGSLSKETRLRVERDLKDGRLKCVISSTSLELGIDIGYIDLVVQIGSPKSVAKGLQRIGRSGHAYGATAKGRFMVFELDDLVECTTLVKCAYEGKIDRIRIPKNSLDVLSQVLVGMSLEKRWDVDEAYGIIRNSYCYHDLPKEKFLEVLNYLGGHVLGDVFYSKIWFDPEEGKFGRKKTSRMIFFMNLGTIPDEADYLVVDVEGKRLGDLSEKFVEKLQKGDVFVLGARAYEVVRITSTRVVVRDATGKRPTVPSWVGEMLPRSFDLSIEVGKFREWVENKIQELGKEETVKLLIKEYYLSQEGARSIVSYISEQMHYAVPTHRRVVIEGYVDQSGKYNIIFHFPFGRRVNDALSRAYAFKISERYGVNVGVSITDDAFMLTSKKKIPLDTIKDLLASEELEDVLKKAVFNTELFKQRFRHVATRSFMVLRKYKGKNISVARQQLRSEKILRILKDIPGFPVMEETFNEILNIAMDMPNARKVLEGIEEGSIKVRLLDYSDTPSIFAHSIILVGISDIVLIEDRSALLKELHLKLLERIIPSDEVEFTFSESEIREYFKNKIRIKNIGDIINFVERAPGVDILHRRGINIYDYSDIDEEDLRREVEKLVWDGKIVSVYSTRLLWTTESMYPVFSTLYARDCNKSITWDGVLEAEEIARKNGLKRSEAMDILKCMEHGYLAGRKFKDGRFYWYIREPVKIERDYALEILIRNLLYFRGPITFEEILYTLKINEEDIRRILKYMVDEGTVVKGRFLIGYGEQYMLREDYDALRKKRGMKKDEVMHFRAERIIRKMSCDEFFDNFLVVFNPNTLKIRGCYEEFLNMIKNGEVAYGRFLGGRLCYAPKKNIPIFAGAYRREGLTDKDRKILSIIAALGEKATIRNIEKMSTFYPSEVRRIIEKLEKNIYVYREVTSLMDTPRYPFRAVVYESKGDEDSLIRRIIRGYGPLSRTQVEWYTGLNFKHGDEYKKVNIEGTWYYYHLAVNEPTREIKEIIPREDPFSYPILHNLYDSFPEIYSYLLVHNGKIISTGDVKDRHDHLYVESVLGDQDDFLRTLGKKWTVITSVPQEEGYHKVGDYYISDDASSKMFSRSKIIAYILWKNRVIPRRFLKTPLDVARFLMVVHSDREMIRAFKKIKLEKYYHSELIYEIVDLNGERGFATMETAAIFQAIKGMKMDKDMETVYHIFEENRKMSIRELLQESPLGMERTYKAIDNLLLGNYIAKHPSGYIIVKSKYPKTLAVDRFVESLHDMFGVLNVKIITEFGGGYIHPIESLYSLEKLELSKGGYLNDGWIYYLDESEIESFECEFCAEKPFVFDPKDPLSRFLRTLFNLKYEGFVVVKDDFVGTVKATGKRKIKISKAYPEEAREIFEKAMNLPP